MILESYPWKQDLLRWKKILVKYNKSWRFRINGEKTYTMVEKSIFYSAFIIRKLIDCGGKLSDEADTYTISAKLFKPSKHIDLLHRWPEEDSHDWEHPQNVTTRGKNICNWLIHSFIFFTAYDEAGRVAAFYLSSDYDRNKALYEISLSEWLKYIDFIISDDIVSMSARYDEKKDDYIYTRKQRNP